jgi:hypothetical protein
MAGYTRNDTSNNIADGNVINATDLDGEYNAIEAAFNESTGHSHDGTSAEGAPITRVGPVQDVEVSATAVTPKSASASNIDLGASGAQFKDLYIDGLAYIDGLGENLLVNSTNSIQFRDSALAINSSADGQLDIIADTELEITTPTVELNTDGQVLAFGADGDVTLTHVADTALQLNTTSSLQFRDSALGINSSADGQLDIYADTQLEITVPTVELNTDGQILAFGADGDVTLTHVADTALLLNGGIALRFRDSALSINSSSDGQLDIDADTELELTAPTVDINASTSVNISNDLKLDSDSAVLSFGTDSEVTLTHVHNIGTELKVVNATTNSVTDVLDLQVESSGIPADGIGSGLTFSTETASGNVEIGGAIRSVTTGLTPTDEEIDLVFYSMRDGSLTEGFRYDSSADTLDVSGGITGTTITGTSFVTSGDMTFGDNDKAIFGAGSDLQIYHSGTSSRIQDLGTGNLIIDTNGTEIQLTSGNISQYMLRAVKDGAVTLYHNGTANPRLATTTTGIDVTGTVTADGLTVDGSLGSFAVQASGAELHFSRNENNDILANGGTSASFTIGANNNLTLKTGATLTQRLQIANNGDISFYEDTGVTPKLFWDASAESLAVGNSSVSAWGSDFRAVDLKDFASIATGNATFQITANGYFDGTNWKYKTTDYASNYLQYQGDHRFRVASSGTAGNNITWTDALTVTSAGNVGIGTTSPAARLHVTGDAGDMLRLDRNNTGAVGNQIAFRHSNAGTLTETASINAVSTANADTGRLSFYTKPTGGSNTERMRIDSSGNLGLGVTPSAWYSGASTLQMKNGAVVAFSGIDGSVSTNAYYDASWKYYGTGAATFYNQNAGIHKWYTAPSGTAGNAITFAQPMTLDASGNLLVGKTSQGFGTSGTEIRADDSLYVTRTDTTAFFNRLSTDGDIVKFYKDSSTVGSIASVAAGMAFYATGVNNCGWHLADNSAMLPMKNSALSDNLVDLGSVSYRFDDIYATNGTIQTSDRNEKQDIEALSEAEQRVAVAAKGLLRKFRWKSSVEEKGDDARIHFGIIAQDLQAAFEAEGLDAGRYAMFIHSTWTDEETGEERSRMGVRYSELLAFIIAAI